MRLFRSVKAKNADSPACGPVDIIRRDDSRASLLPRISGVSLFPDFERPDIVYDGVDNHILSLPMPFQAATTTQGSQKTLLPVKSLSQFNLSRAYSLHSDLSDLQTRRQKAYWPVEQLTDVSTGRVPSHKAELVSKKSTLQIRRPESVHGSISNATLATSTSSDASSVIRRTKRSTNLRECATLESSAAKAPLLTPIAEHNRLSDFKPSQEDSIRLVRQFASFCVIDIGAPGCPVSAVSEDLRYLYDVKDRFVLNAQECSELSMDLSVGRDPDGNEVTYLLLFSPLVSPSTTKSRFLLVSAIDVSGYVRYAAGLESGKEKKSPTSSRKRAKPQKNSSSVSWIDKRTDQLADELLHGCSMKEAPASNSASRHRTLHTADSRRSKLDSEDVWTAIAREEGLTSRGVFAASSSAAYDQSASPPLCRRREEEVTASLPDPNHADGKVLETFIDSLQLLYSQYFLLACSPLNGQFYEICYVSPAVYESGEHVSGHLSHTSFTLINELEAQLATGRRFRTVIRWGNGGIEKQLFCVPLTGHQPAPWICMLVDKETPIEW